MTRSASTSIALSALLSLSTIAALSTTADARVQRVDGDKRISPDIITLAEIQRSAKSNIIGVFQVCIDSKGDVADIGVVRSTNFRAYDAKIQRQIRTWRYQPVLLDGKPSPFCTMVTLIYQQKR
jgi:hypothetical protein